MFKNMKLGSKIVGGFSLVLIITAIIAYVGYGGLSGTVERVINADDANRLIKWAKDCRQSEKNFIMRGDMKYVEQNSETIQNIYTQIDETKARFKDQADINTIEDVRTEIQNYEKAIKSWVDIYGQQKEYEETMVLTAREFSVECENIRADQKAKLTEELADPNSTAAQLDDRLWKADAANRLIKFVQDCRIQEKNFMMRGDKNYLQEIDEHINDIYVLCDEMNSRFNQQVNKEQVAKVKTAGVNYKGALDSWEKLYEQRLVQDDNMVTAARAAVAGCDNLRNGQKAKMDSQIASSTNIMLIGALIGILFGSFLAFFITRSITKPVNLIISNLTQGGEQVSSASEQVAAASQSLAEGASEQASSLEEISSSIEEMAGMTRQNSDNSKQADTLSADVNNNADKGMSAMNSMSGAMQEIKKSSDETAKVIKVIDEIAFQTNLLALNAAVEAARAGEAGKGFAVVAEEVRNLAQRSAEAAKETSAMIEGSQKNAEDGVKSADELLEILKNVDSGIKKVASLIAEITAASDEQTQGVEQINSAVGQLDQVTQQNASNAEESSSASEELASQAQEMQRVVEDLSSLVHGAKENQGGSHNTSNYKTPKKRNSITSKAHGIKDKIQNMSAKRQNNAPASMKENKNMAEDVIPLDEKEMAEF